MASLRSVTRRSMTRTEETEGSGLNMMAYLDHKLDWFPEVDLDVPLSEKEAFLLTDDKIREDFKNRYIGTSGLYYQGQPDFDDILRYIQANLKKLG